MIPLSTYFLYDKTAPLVWGDGHPTDSTPTRSRVTRVGAPVMFVAVYTHQQLCFVNMLYKNHKHTEILGFKTNFPHRMGPARYICLLVYKAL